MVLRDSTPRVGSETDNYGSEGQVHFRFSEGQPGDPEMTMSPHGGRHGHNGCLVRSKGAARSENTGQADIRKTKGLSNLSGIKWGQGGAGSKCLEFGRGKAPQAAKIEDSEGKKRRGLQFCGVFKENTAICGNCFQLVAMDFRFRCGLDQPIHEP